MHAYTKQLIARGAIKVPAYRKRQHEAAAKFDAHSIVESTVEEVLERDLFDAVDRILVINRVITDAVEEALQDADYESRFDKIEDDLDDHVSRIGHVDDRVDDLDQRVGELLNEFSNLNESVNNPKGFIARWLRL